MTRRWKHRPEGSNWGEFGADDQLGRLNLLTAERVVRAAAEVRSGHVFCLSLPLDLPGGNVLAPRRHPPRLLSPARGPDRVNFLYPLALDGAGATDVISDDAVLLFTQYSTQWDGLSHVGSIFDADGDGDAELVFYNGWRADTDMTAADAERPCDPGGLYHGNRANALGIERMAQAGCQGRGVLVDLRRHLDSQGGSVGAAQLLSVIEADGIVVEEGDILCIHTGYADLLRQMGGAPDPMRLERECACLDGADPDLLDWITESGVAAIAADNFAVETVPKLSQAPGRPLLPLHEHCLFKLGIHLGELWYLTELADWLRSHGRHRFLLTAPPLNLPGAVGSPTTPIATV